MNNEEMGEELIAAKKDIGFLKERHHKIEERIDDVCKEIKEMREKLLKRPSWAILVVITLLSTLCSSLIVSIALMK